MAKIKVTVDPSAQSGEITKEAVLQLANANTPVGTNPRAEVIRDAQGKVVQVDVHLPEDIAAADLSNAASAINGNPGVATNGTVAMPLSITNGVESFEDEADGVFVDAVGSETAGEGFRLSPGGIGNQLDMNNEGTNANATDGVLSLRYKVDPASPPVANIAGVTQEGFVHKLQYQDINLAYDALKAKFTVHFATNRDVTGGQPGSSVSNPKSACDLEQWGFVFGSAQVIFSMGSIGSPNFHNAGELNAIVAGGIGGSVVLSPTITKSPDLPLDADIEVTLEYSLGASLLEATLSWNGGANTHVMTFKRNEVDNAAISPITNRFASEFFVYYSRIKSGLTPSVPAPSLIHADCYQDELDIQITNILSL